MTELTIKTCNHKVYTKNQDGKTVLSHICTGTQRRVHRKPTIKGQVPHLPFRSICTSCGAWYDVPTEKG